MPHKKSPPTDNWAALFQQELDSMGRKPAGPGWKTLEELRSTGLLRDCGYNTALKRVQALLRSGKLEHFQGSAKTVTGVIRQQVWYRIKSA